MRKIILALGFALCAVPAAAGTGLFVGDSHSVGPFGWRLDGLLRKAGRKTATYASCGSIEQWWVTGKPTPCGYFFRDLKREYRKRSERQYTDLYGIARGG